jgi:hypothetical protein
MRKSGPHDSDILSNCLVFINDKSAQPHTSVKRLVTWAVNPETNRASASSSRLFPFLRMKLLAGDTNPISHSVNELGRRSMHKTEKEK